MNKPERICADTIECHELKYIAQHKFPDCRNILPLTFDFYLPDLNAAIEFDGMGHYKKIYGDLAKIQKRDAIKDKYCADNNIPLLRIPYWERPNIDKLISAFIAKTVDKIINDRYTADHAAKTQATKAESTNDESEATQAETQAETQA